MGAPSLGSPNWVNHSIRGATLTHTQMTISKNSQKYLGRSVILLCVAVDLLHSASELSHSTGIPAKSNAKQNGEATLRRGHARNNSSELRT